jgi:hypothetical protein
VTERVERSSDAGATLDEKNESGSSGAKLIRRRERLTL